MLFSSMAWPVNSRGKKIIINQKQTSDTTAKSKWVMIPTLHCCHNFTAAIIITRLRATVKPSESISEFKWVSAVLWVRVQGLHKLCYILLTDTIQLIAIYAKWPIGGVSVSSAILWRADCGACNRSLKVNRGAQLDCILLIITIK